MDSTVQTTDLQVTVPSASELLLRHRLKVVEDMWESVLRQECGQQTIDLLRQLVPIDATDGRSPDFLDSEVLQLIEKLDLNDAIRAARAFALYFQLINIVEQHYEQQDRERESANTDNLVREQALFEAIETDSGEEFTLAKTGKRGGVKPGSTFASLFPTLKQLNVPPQIIQRLLDNLDIRLVFTAHPTEIVRQTIRAKQRRIAKILRQLDRVEERLSTLGVPSSLEAEALQEQLTEEIRLWWRTDELHQFKPSVLDEVEYALHYFKEVLFDALPQLYQRITRNLHSTFPNLTPPSYNFCKFGSWVGSDRDGNPSVTPQVTWQTSCYQRSLVLEKYIDAIQDLTHLLSLSLH